MHAMDNSATAISATRVRVELSNGFDKLGLNGM